MRRPLDIFLFLKESLPLEFTRELFRLSAQLLPVRGAGARVLILLRLRPEKGNPVGQMETVSKGALTNTDKTMLSVSLTLCPRLTLLLVPIAFLAVKLGITSKILCNKSDLRLKKPDRLTVVNATFF